MITSYFAFRPYGASGLGVSAVQTTRRYPGACWLEDRVGGTHEDEIEGKGPADPRGCGRCVMFRFGLYIARNRSGGRVGFLPSTDYLQYVWKLIGLRSTAVSQSVPRIFV